MTQHGESMETDRRQAGLQVWNAARNIGHEESGSEAKFFAIIRACWLLLGVEEHRTRHQNGMIH